MMFGRGSAWCSTCRDWRDAFDVRGGKCAEHRRTAERERYAKDGSYRFRRKQKTAQRVRGVDAVPPSGEELLLEMFGGQCAYCNGPAETWDHVVPVARGGVTELWNIVPACKRCNSSKRDKDMDEWLASKGFVPSRYETILELQLMEYLPLSHHVVV
jgi:5-methylcytosine-specific restriction endonuclease McrA